MKKASFAFVIFLLLTNFSYSFTAKENELYLCSIYKKGEYNHYTYFFMLDTLKSTINIYKDSYGKVSHEYSLTICPDSSILFYRYMEGFIRLNIKDGLIRSRTYEDGYVEGFSYDEDNHLINIRNKANLLTFIWKNDSLVEFQHDGITRDGNLSKVITCHLIPATPLCHAMKSPELFCRMYEHWCFNEILFSMLGLYGEWPITPNNYTLEYDEYSFRNTKVTNTYSTIGMLFETHSISEGHEYTQRFDWNFDNMNRIFDYRNKIK